MGSTEDILHNIAHPKIINISCGRSERKGATRIPIEPTRIVAIPCALLKSAVRDASSGPIFLK